MLGWLNNEMVEFPEVNQSPFLGGDFSGGRLVLLPQLFHCLPRQLTLPGGCRDFLYVRHLAGFFNVQHMHESIIQLVNSEDHLAH